jgi:hypothetical protein
MMRFVMWWGHDSSLAIKLWQLFCFWNTTVFWLSNDGSCFVVVIRQLFGYRIMAVVLRWGYDSSLVIE